MHDGDYGRGSTGTLIGAVEASQLCENCQEYLRLSCLA